MEELIINGCSYMHEYARGFGHWDLAKQLQIPKANSITRPGSSNSRIIRTTLKHSYQTSLPTFYVIGISFLCRWELPINETPNDLEGRWIRIPIRQKRSLRDEPLNFQFNWTDQDSDVFNKLNYKSATFGIADLLEELMFRLLSMLADLRSRGHQALIYAQADDSTLEFLNQDRFKFLHQDMSFVDGLNWLAVPWQLDQGIPTLEQYLSTSEQIDLPPKKYHHLMKGHHTTLNKFLIDYIDTHNILK